MSPSPTKRLRNEEAVWRQLPRRRPPLLDLEMCIFHVSPEPESPDRVRGAATWRVVSEAGARLPAGQRPFPEGRPAVGSRLH